MAKLEKSRMRTGYKFGNLFLLRSFWPRHPDIHRPRDRHARYHGEQLRGQHPHRPSHLAGLVHLPPDALLVRELPGNFISWISRWRYYTEYFEH